VSRGGVTMYPRTEMLDVVVVNGRARGIVTRDMVSGAIETHLADAVILGTGGYGNVFYLSTNAKGSNVTPVGLPPRHDKRRPAWPTLVLSLPGVHSVNASTASGSIRVSA